MIFALFGEYIDVKISPPCLLSIQYFIGYVNLNVTQTDLTDNSHDLLINNY